MGISSEEVAEELRLKSASSAQVGYCAVVATGLPPSLPPSLHPGRRGKKPLSLAALVEVVHRVSSTTAQRPCDLKSHARRH